MATRGTRRTVVATPDIGKKFSHKGARGNQKADDPNRVFLKHDNGALPLDIPVTVGIERVMGAIGRSGADGLLGHVLSLYCFSKAMELDSRIRIEVKFIRDPNALIVLVNEEEVYRWVEDPVVTPKGRERLDRQREVDLDLADALDLKVGDVVEEDDDGELVIIEEDEEEIVWE